VPLAPQKSVMIERKIFCNGLTSMQLSSRQ
jgi:hypothetical protein